MLHQASCDSDLALHLTNWLFKAFEIEHRWSEEIPASKILEFFKEFFLIW